MEETPNRLWYVAYVFLWVPAGIACYFAWRMRDREEAKRQFWYSTWIGVLFWAGLVFLLELALFPLGLIFG